MKMSDINQKLTERPGGFGGIIKSKIKQQIPFARGVQRRGKAEEALIKSARKIKAALNDWKNQAFRSSGGEKAPLTMNQFLGWVKKSQPKYAKGIEAYARGDKAYAKHFSQAIDSKGKQSSTASDDKVNRQGKPTSDEIKKGREKEAAAAEQEARDLDSENPKHDLRASKGDDKEPKVDTSASIYEARLRAILEADDEEGIDPDVDVGVDAAQPLSDNQIDTLITMGIEKQIELNGGESIVDKPSEVMSKSSSDKSDFSGGEASDDFLGEYQDELVSVLTKVKNGDDLDKRDKSNAGKMLYSLD